MNKTNRIHQSQDKTNCFFGVGDEIELTLKDNITCDKKTYRGKILDIDLRLQTGTKYDGIHPCITVLVGKGEKGNYTEMFWLENIANIKVLKLN